LELNSLKNPWLTWGGKLKRIRTKGTVWGRRGPKGGPWGTTRGKKTWLWKRKGKFKGFTKILRKSWGLTPNLRKKVYRRGWVRIALLIIKEGGSLRNLGIFYPSQGRFWRKAQGSQHLKWFGIKGGLKVLIQGYLL